MAGGEQAKTKRKLQHEPPALQPKRPPKKRKRISNEQAAAPQQAALSKEPTPSKPTKRYSTVYDAVAGRVAANNRFLSANPSVSRYRDTVSSSTLPVPADEVLFRRKNAPLRYEENDIYWADTHLLPHQRLPDSDLLKAIHRYVSDFYTSATKSKGRTDVKSFDETALLCMGILLEESAKEVLGETGNLAFTEAHDEHERYGHGMGNERSVIMRDAAAIRSGITRKRNYWRQKAESEGIAGEDGEIAGAANEEGEAALVDSSGDAVGDLSQTRTKGERILQEQYEAIASEMFDHSEWEEEDKDLMDRP